MSCVRSAPACVICLQANRAFFLLSSTEFNLFLVGYYLFLCQSTLALRIHISEVTKRILEAIGGFVVESRGEVYLKVSLVTARY